MPGVSAMGGFDSSRVSALEANVDSSDRKEAVGAQPSKKNDGSDSVLGV